MALGPEVIFQMLQAPMMGAVTPFRRRNQFSASRALFSAGMCKGRLDLRGLSARFLPALAPLNTPGERGPDHQVDSRHLQGGRNHERRERHTPKPRTRQDGVDRM
jgi:hypothetical protein